MNYNENEELSPEFLIPLNAAKVRTFLYIHKIFGLFSSFLISRKLSFCWAKEGEWEVVRRGVGRREEVRSTPVQDDQQPSMWMRSTCIRRNNR